ncbi:MAG: helix-turn-helix transcriptional regulator [Candidatus Manganitrophaceae bacterium]
MKASKWFTEKLEAFKEDIDFRTEEVILELTDKISEIMARDGVNRSELANRLGVSKAFITKLLNGNPNLTLRTLVSIATALGCDVTISLPRIGLKLPAANSGKSSTRMKETSIFSSARLSGAGGRRSRSSRPIL